TPLWSGPADPSIQFTTLPLGSFVVPRAGSELGRLLVYYPGDGATRQAGLAWVAGPDVAPSGPPPWITSSEVDGDNATALAVPGPRRQVPIAPPPVSAPEIAVVDDETGLMLYGRAPHAHAAPASTTKIATALVTLEHAQSLDASVRVAVDGWAMAAAAGAAHRGLQTGQLGSMLSLRDS